MNEIDISPDMQMYNIFENISYNPAYAIAEFVDNAIQSFVNNKENLPMDEVNVKVDYYSNKYKKISLRNTIIISDNSSGIKSQDIQYAFKPASAGYKSELNEFGVGMKTSAFWFTRTWDIKTKHFTEDIGNLLNINLDSMLDVGTNTVDMKSCQDITTHGTAIILHNITALENEEDFQNMCTILKEIYRFVTVYNAEMLSERILNLQASIDGVEQDLNMNYGESELQVLNFPKTIIKKVGGKENHYKVGESVVWQENINFKFQEVNVSGFLAVMPKVDRKNAGIYIKRYRRVIKGIYEKGILDNKYLPEEIFGDWNKHSSQRFFGVLNISDSHSALKVDFTKSETLYKEKDFWAVLLHQHPRVKELIKQSATYRPTIESKESYIKVDEEENIPNHNTKKTKPASVQSKTGEDSNKKIIEECPVKKLLNGLSYPENILINKVIGHMNTTYNNGEYILSAMCLRILLEKALITYLENNKAMKKGFSGLNVIIKKSFDYAQKQTDKNEKLITALNSILNERSNIIVNGIAHGNQDITKQTFDAVLTNSQYILEKYYKK